MKKDELHISKIKLESKSRGDIFNPSQKSPKNSKQVLKKSKKPKTLLKDVINRNKDDSLRKHENNLNSCTIDINNIQNMVYQSETYNANIGSNYINHNTEKNTPFLASKVNKIFSQNNKNQNKKRTVNKNKKIEEIIRRRILDNKNIKTNSLIQNNSNAQKKLNITNKRTETSKDLKKGISLKKKRNTYNKKDSKLDEIKKSNKNENNKSNKAKKYKNKYCETNGFLKLDKLEENNLDNNFNNDNVEESKLYNINSMNLNTEVINDEKIYNNLNNNLRSINYDYDSCYEEDEKSKKSQLIKSQSRSKPSKNLSQDKDDFNYDTMTPNCISKIEDKKNYSSYKNINKINDITEIKKNKDEEDSKKDENKDNETKLNKINVNNSKNTKENKNNSIANINDFSADVNLSTTEKNNFSYNCHSKARMNTQIKIEIENIKKKISNSSKVNNQNKNNDIYSIEVKPFNPITERVSINTSSNRNIPNIIYSNKKINVYAPKKINNHFSIKNNSERNNDRAIGSAKKEKKIDIILLGENDNSHKDKNISLHKITYTKKISKAYFRKNSGSNKITLDRENSYNEAKRNNFKIMDNIPKLNSSFESTNNLRMNNIFMNNNYYNNNFNYQYGKGTTGSLFNSTEYQSLNNYFSLNNHYCKLNNNTSSFCYEINLPKQLLFQMDNDSNNNNINSSYKNNYIMPVNKEKHPPESININFADNRLEYLSKNINFEDFIILEQKMIDIKNTLSGKNLVVNECFEYLNYYYNSSIYNNFEYLFSNSNDINYLKICLGYKILSVIICYNCSLDINVFEQTYLLLKEIIDLNYKCIILLFEYIIENILFNNEDIKNNLWLLRMENDINNFKIIEQKKAYNEYIKLNNDSHMTILEKIKININFIVNNLNTILNNIKTKNSDYLLTLFKSINEEFYKNAFFYFFNYILRIINLQGSIIGSTIVQNHLINNRNLMIPYIKTKNIKKYSLVLDLEETLLHFNMNITNNNEGVVSIRPGAIKFLDNISEYYELIAFNEGEQKYTDILIDSLEENKIYFEQRFYRDHITIDNNDIVKDLINIGRALDKIIIVDNMPQNFKLQKNNGIVIKSYWGDNPNDNILNELEKILIKIAKDGGDIRKGLIKYKDEIIKKIVIGDKDNI